MGYSRPVFGFQQVREPGKGFVCGVLVLLPLRQPESSVFALDQAGVFLVFPVVAIQTQVLPVTAVRGVVVMVVVLVMDGQFVQVVMVKFAPAARADPRVQA